MDANPAANRELELLEQIEANPDVNQATLADRLGVAVGTVNWHIKRLVSKGYVKVKRAERKKLRYIITPEGLTFRARLTMDYIEQSFIMYRRIRGRAQEQIERLVDAGHTKVRIEATGDIADVCRLSCLEQGVAIVEDEDAPVLRLEGMKVVLDL